MHVWNLLHAARWKYRTQKSSKNRHLGTITQLCPAVSSQLRHVSTIWKEIVKQQYLLHVSPQHDELRPTNGWDRFGCLGHPSKFQRVSRLAFVTTATSLTGGQPNFARCLAVSCAGTLYIYTFSGALAPWRNFVRCKIHFTFKSCVLLYWQHYCTAIVSQTLRRGTRNEARMFAINVSVPNGTVARLEQFRSPQLRFQRESDLQT